MSMAEAFADMAADPQDACHVHGKRHQGHRVHTNKSKCVYVKHPRERPMLTITFTATRVEVAVL